MALGTMPLAGTLKNGWVIPPANTGFGGADYLSRLDVAVFGLTANTVDAGDLLLGRARRQQPADDRGEEVHA